MVSQKAVTEQTLDNSFSDIEKRIGFSFQLVKKDIEDLDERISKVKIASPSGEIESLKEKLSKKFTEIKEEIKLIKESLLSKQKFSEEKSLFQKDIELIKKQITKEGLKEEVYNLVSSEIEEKFSILKKEILSQQGDFEKKQIEHIKKIEKEKEEIIKEKERQIEKTKKIFEEEKENIMNELRKRISERDKEIASYKGQVAFLKGRINIIQESLKEGQIKEYGSVKDSKKDKKVFYEEKKIKMLPNEEEIKYNKDGVNPGFISKIIDSLSEK